MTKKKTKTVSAKPISLKKAFDESIDTHCCKLEEYLRRCPDLPEYSIYSVLEVKRNDKGKVKANFRAMYDDRKGDNTEIQSISSSSKKSKKRSRGPKSVYSWKDICSTKEQAEELCEYMEIAAPHCSSPIELSRETYHNVCVLRWGLPEIPMTEKSGTDNIRKQMGRLEHGQIFSDIVNNHVIRLADGKNLNNPTPWAIERYERTIANRQTDNVEEVKIQEYKEDSIPSFFFSNKSDNNTESSAPVSISVDPFLYQPVLETMVPNEHSPLYFYKNSLTGKPLNSRAM